MNVSGSELRVEEIKSYLLQEMADDERTSFERKLFENDDLFFEAEEAENQLVDLYIRDKLDTDVKKRFEQSLQDLPARREKIANAVALRSYIDEERPADTTVAVVQKQTIWKRLASLVPIASPAGAFSMAALMLVFLSTTVLLIFDNHRKSDELNRLEAMKSGTEAELQMVRDQFSREHESVGDLSEQNETQRGQIISLTNKLNEQKGGTVPKQLPTPPSSTTSVTFPALNKDLNNVPVTTSGDTKRVVIQIPLPASVAVNSELSIELNGKVIARDLPVRVSDGKNSVHFTANADDLRDGPNQLRVLDPSGTPLTTYTFNKERSP